MLAPQFARKTSDPQSAKISGTPSAPLNKRTGSPEPNVGTLLNLIFLGIVATSTVVVFFGLGFSLLARSNEKMVVGAGFGVEVEAGSPDLVPSPEKDAVPSKVLTEPTNPALSFSNSVSSTQPSEAQAVLPPANTEMAWSSLPTSAADAVAADATLRGLRSKSDQATPTTPTGTDAKRTEIGRPHHYGARKDWARLSPPTYRSSATSRQRAGDSLAMDRPVGHEHRFRS